MSHIYCIKRDISLPSKIMHHLFDILSYVTLYHKCHVLHNLNLYKYGYTNIGDMVSETLTCHVLFIVTVQLL